MFSLLVWPKVLSGSCCSICKECNFNLYSGCSISCQKSGYLTVFDGGQTGNKMSQYATLLAHADRIGVQPVLSSQMRDDLLLHFPRLR